MGKRGRPRGHHETAHEKEEHRRIAEHEKRRADGEFEEGEVHIHIHHHHER